MRQIIAIGGGGLSMEPDNPLDVTGTGHPDLVVQSTFGASAPDDLEIYEDQRGHWVQIFKDAGLPKIVTLPRQPLPVLLFTHGGTAWGYRWQSGKGYVGLTAAEISAASAQVGWSERNPTPDRSKPEPVVPTTSE